MPNLDPWVNQNENMITNTINKFENYLLSIRDERQTMIHPNSHPTYNERQQKIIKMIDWTLEKYKAAVNTQKMNELYITLGAIFAKTLDRIEMGNREDENEIRRKITLHSFRRYVKTTISDLGYADYSE